MSFSRIIWVLVVVARCLPVNAQSVPIYDSTFNDLKKEALEMFDTYRTFHQDFFKIPEGWDDLDCGEERLPLIKKWENEGKTKAYKSFFDPDLFTKDGLTYKEAEGASWITTNILPTDFSSFLLRYFKDYDQFYVNNLCDEELYRFRRRKYFIKEIHIDSVDSIGHPLGFDKEPGDFLPIYFNSVKYREGGDTIVYKRVLLVKLDNKNGKWELRFHHLFNRVEDWRQHFSAYDLPILSPKPKLTLAGLAGIDSGSYYLNPRAFSLESEFEDSVQVEWNILNERNKPILEWRSQWVQEGDNNVPFPDLAQLKVISYQQWKVRKEFPEWQLAARLSDGSKGDTISIVFADPLVARGANNRFIRNLNGGPDFFHGDMYPYADFFHGAKKSRTNIRCFYSKYFHQDSSVASLVIKHKIPLEFFEPEDTLFSSLGYESGDSYAMKEVIIEDSLTGKDLQITFNKNALFSIEKSWTEAEHYELPIVWNSHRFQRRKDSFNIGLVNHFVKQYDNPYPLGKFTLSIYQEGTELYQIPFLVGKIPENMLELPSDTLLQINTLETYPVFFSSKISSQVRFFGGIESRGNLLTDYYELPHASDSSLLLTAQSLRKIRSKIGENNHKESFVLRVIPETNYKDDINPVEIPIAFGVASGTVTVNDVRVSTATSGAGERARLLFDFVINQNNTFQQGGMLKVKQFYLGATEGTLVDYDSAYYDPVHGKRLHHKGIKKLFSNLNIFVSSLNFLNNSSRIKHVFRYTEDNYSYQRFKFVVEYVEGRENQTGLQEQSEHISHIAYIDPVKWERSLFPYEPLFNGWKITKLLGKKE